MSKPAFHLIATEEQIARLTDLMHDAGTLNAGMHTVVDAGTILGNLIQILIEMVAIEIRDEQGENYEAPRTTLAGRDTL